MDVFSLCRSCMKEVATEERSFSQDTVNMFTFCTNIPVRSEEQLPRQFCDQCTSTIQSCYTFVYTAREVDLRLKAMIGIVESAVKPELSESSHKFDLPGIKPEQFSHSQDNVGSVEIKAEPVFSLVDTSRIDDENSSRHSEAHDRNDNPLEIIASPISLLDDLKTYICTVCMKGFVRKKNYENHMLKYHTKGRVRRVKEKYIQATMPKKSKTMKSEDLILSDYICPHCPEKFETARDRQRHKRQKHRRRLFECPHCPHRFAERQLLTAHMRKHTQTKQQFTCDYCNKIFKEKSRLLLHLHMHDDTLKPHLCDICGSRYSHRQAMLNHQLVHTGKKPFTCDLCGYTCRQASNIRRHNRAHLNERKHQCVECGKGFNELSSLKKHMYAHTGERPYKCPNCDSSYKSSGKRKIHLIRAHGLDPSEIPRLAKDGGPARRYVTEETRTVFSLVADRSKKVQTGN